MTIGGHSRGVARPGGLGRWLERVAEGLAVSGGILLLGLVLLTVCSIVLRRLAGLDWFRSLPLLGQLRPPAGDFELIELGVAVAVFASLPYCQLRGGNVAVTVFTQRLGAKARAGLEAFAHGVYALIAGLLTWRLAAGLLDRLDVGQTTMVLRLPVWWAYLPSVAALAVLTLICAHDAAKAIGRLTRTTREA